MDDSSAFNELINFSNPKLSRGLSSTDVHQNFVVSYVWAMPFDRMFHRLPRLTKGWQLQGITRFATGFPIQMGQGNPVTGRATVSVVGCATGMPPLPAAPPPICRISWDRFTSTTLALRLAVTYFDQSAFTANCMQSDVSGSFNRP